MEYLDGKKNSLKYLLKNSFKNFIKEKVILIVILLKKKY